MRRVLFAVLAMAAIGGYAEAGLDSTAPENTILTGIQSFITQQRQVDADACLAAGQSDLDACIRDRAKQRRAQLEGAEVPTAPAGADI
jgi:hypothetical protein